MAARSVTIKVQNTFDIALIFDHDSLQHGIWGSSPPARIEPQSTAQWVAESNGIATGTEGTVWYRLDVPGTTGLVRLYWDNPFIGSNSYDQSGPDVLTVARSGDGSGDDSTAHWVVTDASTTGDGIPDSWKTAGATIDPGDGSGPQFVDLPAMGATVGKPDIFVHLDWMEDGTHSHRPSDAAIRLVIDAFANAPYIARNGAVGINLHVDAGPTSIMNVTTGTTWGALSRAASVGHVASLGTTGLDGAGNTTYDWTDFDKLKQRAGGHFKSGRAPIFRYAIACHQIGSIGNSGLARNTPGSDFIVSLGTFGAVTDMNTAGTFMHELGHALGLDHGGKDGVNNKPNYISVMNYLWQFSGIRRNGVFVLDYSSVALAVLNEIALNETIGLGPGSAGYGTSRWLPAVPPNPGAFVQVPDASQPIDWDGDGLATNLSVATDANNDTTQGVLAPCNDWQILRLRGGAVGAGGFEPPTISPLEPELTPQLQALILPPDVTAPATTAIVFPTPNGAGWNRTPVSVALTATDDISGVARTEYRVDGIGPNTYTTPIEVTAEGFHDVGFSSVDRSQNIELQRHAPVRIDLTAPEVVISYDPHLDEIVVEGIDGLSGIDPGAVALVSRTDVEWTSFGSDVAEIRVYEARDRAGNTTTLYLKVRCSPFCYEASVLGLMYDDHRHAGHGDLAARREQAADMARNATDVRPNGARRVDRNTMVFQRLVGRGSARPLLGVRQLIAIGAGGSRRTVNARYDSLDDYTIIVRQSGAGSCGPCRDLDQRTHERPEERPATNGSTERPNPPGCDERRPDDEQPGHGAETRAGIVSINRGNNPTAPTPAAPCGPTNVSETDVRGLVTLHVLSEDGRLHVAE